MRFLEDFSGFGSDLRESMKALAMHPNSEVGNYRSLEFDPQADFHQFLKEAKNHAYEESFKAIPPHVGETRKADLHEERRKRKSWKSSLFSWLKMDKKKKTTVEPLEVSTNHHKVRRGGIFSGPIQGSAVSSISSRSWKPTSGPLPSLFNPSKKEVDEMVVPYMCLNQVENPHEAHSYGPVYLVT